MNTRKKILGAVLLSFVLFAQHLGVGYAEDAGSDCYISPDDPIVLSVDLGQTGYIYCDESGIAFGVEGESLNPSAAMEPRVAQYRNVCNTQSTLYDNAIGNLRVTQYTLSMPFVYDGSNITSAGPVYGSTYARGATGWYLTYSSQYIYNDPLPGPVKGAEGWAGFNGLNNAYPHEHRVVQYANGAGGCAATDYFSGTIPYLAYHTVESYLT